MIYDGTGRGKERLPLLAAAIRQGAVGHEQQWCVSNYVYTCLCMRVWVCMCMCVCGLLNFNVKINVKTTLPSPSTYINIHNITSIMC